MKKLLMKWFGISATKRLPFDIEAVKKGARVVTRDGREAVYVGDKSNLGEYPHSFDVKGTTFSVTCNGNFSIEGERDLDLFILGDPTFREIFREVWKHPRFKFMSLVNAAWYVLNIAAIYLIMRSMVIGSLEHVLLYSVGVIGINSIYKTNVRK